MSWEAVVLTSEDPTRFPQRPHVRYVHATMGPAGKRAWGVYFTTAPCYVFLDDDAIVAQDTLYQFVRFFEAQPQCGMQFARLYNAERRTELDDAGSWLTGTGFLYARAGDPTADRADIEHVARRCLASKSACCAIRREVYHQVGGFNPDYFILAEETDLAWRVWLSGQEVWYNPDAVGWHWFNTTRKPVDQYYTPKRIHYLGARNYLMLLTTNCGTWTLLRILPVHLLIWLVTGMALCLRGQWQRGWLILCGVGAWGRQLPATWRKRQHVQRTRRMGEWHLYWQIQYPAPPLYYIRRLEQYLWNLLHG